MDLIDWFDPDNIEHIKAYNHLQETGTWPKDFLPEDIEIETPWGYILANRLADKFVEEKLKMRVREKIKPNAEMVSSRFNIHALGEVICYWPEGDADSMYIKDLDVFVEALDEWKDMRQAFKDKDIIVNDLNTCFFEPKTKEDRERGYTL